MGFIIDSNKMLEKYKGIIKQKYFVDKSNLINKFNKLIEKDNSKYLCITKPKRFGKTSIAAMLTTYYSKGIDSKEIFDKLNVSKGISSDEEEKQLEIKQYNEFQGKYHTLYFDFSKGFQNHKNLKDYLASINKKLKMDFKMLFPKLELLDDINLIFILEQFYIITKEKFILIIDEWDYIISNDMFSSEEQKDYLNFLKDLIKDQEYIAFAYMTAVLPIAKQKTTSPLNCFTEYSMINDDEYYQYFGFTEEEVKDLCEKNKKIYLKEHKKKLNNSNSIKYEDLELWYNGYKSYNGEKIFNPWSVIQALSTKKVRNYWTNSGRNDELKKTINFGISDVKDDFIELIVGNELSIKLKNFGAEDIMNERKKKRDKQQNKDEESNDMKMKIELYSKMVTYGYLTYYNEKISIPNEEIKEKFIELYRDIENNNYFRELILNSEEIFNLTLKKDTEGLCEKLEQVHMKRIKPGDKIDHGNLKRVIDNAYFCARNSYKFKEEEPKGKGVIDYILLPNDKKEPVIIIELKVDIKAESAIKQIHKKKYYNGLEEEGYKGKVLLVGISLKKKNKEYTCIIEEYKESMESIDKNIKKNEKKRKNEPSSNYEYYNLRNGRKVRKKNFTNNNIY